MRSELRRVARAVRPLTARTAGIQARRLVGTGLTLVGWHRLGPEAAYPDDGLTTPLADFRRHLDVLEEVGASVLPLPHALEAQANGTLPPRAVSLSFDDGYASVIEHAWPLLRERGWPATLYVVSDYLDGTGTFPWDESLRGQDLVRLAPDADVAAAAGQGLHLGSHTVTHRWLPHLDDVALAEEMTRSRGVLQDRFGTAFESLAYPMGGWSPRVRDAARAAGYASALTCDRGVSLPRTDPLELRRAFAPDSAEDLALLLGGAYTFLRPLDSWRTRGGPR